MNNKWFARKLIGASNHETPRDIRKYAMPHKTPLPPTPQATAAPKTAPAAPQAPDAEAAMIQQMLKSYQELNATERTKVEVSLERPAHEHPHEEWKNAAAYTFLTPGGAVCTHMRADLYLEMHALLVEVLKDRAGYEHDPWMKARGPSQLYRMQHELFERYEHGPLCGRHVLPSGEEIVCHLVSFTPPVKNTIYGPKKQVFSLLLSRLLDVSGHVHVCVLSGRVHICEEGLCKREVYNTADVCFFLFFS